MLSDENIFHPEKIGALLQDVLLKTRIQEPVQLTVVLMTDAAIQVYNNRYRQKDQATNVLAFPSSEKNEPWLILPNQPIFLGDIFISWETVVKESAEQGKSNHHHAMHVLIHGFLHLLHYDHQNDEEAEEMEALERAIFRQAGWPDPYSGAFPEQWQDPVENNSVPGKSNEPFSEKSRVLLEVG
jgi:probable rRNA maturation factor